MLNFNCLARTKKNKPSFWERYADEQHFTLQEYASMIRGYQQMLRSEGQDFEEYKKKWRREFVAKHHL